MERSSSLAWKTGLFVVLGLVFVTAILLTIRNPRLLQEGYEVRVQLDSASGLLIGTPVKFSGVDVGEIRMIDILSEAKAGEPTIELTLWVIQELQLYQDDQVLIGLLGILGEKYIEILPGPNRDQVLQSDQALIATKPVTEAQMTQQLSETLDEFKQALIMVNDLELNLQPWLELKTQVESSLQEATPLISQLEQTTDKAEALMDQWQIVGEEAVGFMNQTEALIENVKQWGPLVVVGFGVLMGLLVVGTFI